MNGIIYIDPHTMRASLTEDSAGMMQYVSTSTLSSKEHTLDYATDMLLGFAEKGICEQLDSVKYRRLFGVSMVVVVAIVFNFTIGSGEAWINILVCAVWTAINAVIIFYSNYQKWNVCRLREDPAQKAKMKESMKRSLEERKDEPFNN